MEEEEVLVPGKRYSVFAIRTLKNGNTIWVRAGVAFVQPDDSMNLSLDVLPIDGQLHIREVAPKHQQQGNHHHHNHTNNHPVREQPAAPAVAAESMGGH